MDIKDLIKEKGVKNKLFDDWVSSASNALEVLGDSISKDDLKKILQSSSSLNVFNNMVRLIYLESKKPNISIKTFDKIKRYSQGLSYDGRAKNFTIKEYPLIEWFDSITVVSLWLEKNSLDADFVSIVDYIACSTEVVNLTSDDLELVNIVKGFLKDFGFEKSSVRS